MNIRKCLFPIAGSYERQVSRGADVASVLVIIAWLCPAFVHAQDSCSTVDEGQPTARCEHEGAKCNGGAGLLPGKCVLVKADQACECEALPTPPSPTKGPCVKSGGGNTVVACTRDGQFKAEIQAWDRNWLVYSSAGSELRVYKWDGSKWVGFGPTDATISNLFTGVVTPSGVASAKRTQRCGPATPQRQGPQKSSRIQCYIWSLGGVVSLDASASSGLPDTTPSLPPANLNPGGGLVPQVSVQSVSSVADVTVNGELLGVGPSTAK